jgi:Rrf2 family cysteine metabolism transcriptional repressor
MIEIARHYGNGPVKRNYIANSQGISSAYLENILISLKTQNLIRTIRGANGGYSLESAPEKISMYQIITALEGSIAPVHCVESETGCGGSVHCIARKFWLDFHEMQVNVLKGTSLQSLLDLEKTGNQIDYCI